MVVIRSVVLVWYGRVPPQPPVTGVSVFRSLRVWYGTVPLLAPGPQSLRPSGGSWIGRRLSMLRLSPFRPVTEGGGFIIHSVLNVIQHRHAARRGGGHVSPACGYRLPSRPAREYYARTGQKYEVSVLLAGAVR
jgi:hypothetical protein